MSTVALEINITNIYDNVEDARRVGQAVELIIGRQNGGVRIREIGKWSNLPLYPAPLNRDNITYGRQETEARLMALGKEFRKRFPVLAEVDFTQDAMTLDGKTWVVDYGALLNNISEHVDRAEVRPVFEEVIATVLKNEALKGVKLNA